MKYLLAAAVIFSTSAMAEWKYSVTFDKVTFQNKSITQVVSKDEKAGLTVRCSHRGYEVGVRTYGNHASGSVSEIGMSFDGAGYVSVPVAMTVNRTGFFVVSSHKEMVIQKIRSSKSVAVSISGLVIDQKASEFDLTGYSSAETVIGCVL